MEPLRRREARRTMLAFTRYTFPKYRANYHHRILAEYLDEFLAGRIKRLLVLMPPQHGKSELVTCRLSAKCWGTSRKSGCWRASHSSELAASMNRDVQQIMDSAAYRDIFPNTKMRELNGRVIGWQDSPGPRPAGGPAPPDAGLLRAGRAPRVAANGRRRPEDRRQPVRRRHRGRSVRFPRGCRVADHPQQNLELVYRRLLHAAGG